MDLEAFDKLARDRLNCKEIAARMGYNSNYFGSAFKKKTGVYPSVYIARLKNESSKNIDT